MIDTIIAIFAGRWKLFLATLIAQVMIAFFLHTGARLPEMLRFLVFTSPQERAGLASPLPSAVNLFNQIESKLQQKRNEFTLKKPVSVIPSAVASANYDLANGHITVDFQTGEVLNGQNEKKRLPIASLTKIMTAVVALDLADYHERFTVPESASQVQPTSIGVVPGQKMSVEELLHALLLTSANDSAHVIKEGINNKYHADVFVRAMNSKAEILGLKNTRFSNPQGFDNPDNFSSAEDLAVLTRYALANYPEIAEIAKTEYKFLPADSNHKQFDLYNWNGLLGVYPGAQGIKIGNTGQAGYTTAVVSQREGPSSAPGGASAGKHKLITIILGAPGVLERDMWAAQALDDGFAKLGLDPVEITEDQLRAKYSTWKYFN